MILSEDDVRAYVREASGGKARWVEPALGSTPGLPDCWVPWKYSVSFGDEDEYFDAQVQLELKCGKIIRNSLCYDVRPEQRKQIIKMMDDGVKVGLIIGIKHSNTLIFTKPQPQFLQGKWSLVDDGLFPYRFECCVDELSSFWSGVNFIFS